MTAALLVADPEPASRGYLERQLASDGFRVLPASWDGEALALAERTRPDLVLCSQLDLCARLREGAPGRTWNRHVPVIVLGPQEADAVDRVRAFQRGADDYVQSPVAYEELLGSISTCGSDPISTSKARFCRRLLTSSRRAFTHKTPPQRPKGTDFGELLRVILVTAKGGQGLIALIPSSNEARRLGR